MYRILLSKVIMQDYSSWAFALINAVGFMQLDNRDP
jgi:hypothetical protein